MSFFNRGFQENSGIKLEIPEPEQVITLFAKKICEYANYDLDTLSDITTAISSAQTRRGDMKTEFREKSVHSFFEMMQRVNPNLAADLEGPYKDILDTLKKLYPKASEESLDILNRENSGIWGQNISLEITNAASIKKGYGSID